MDLSVLGTVAESAVLEVELGNVRCAQILTVLSLQQNFDDGITMPAVEIETTNNKRNEIDPSLT